MGLWKDVWVLIEGQQSFKVLKKRSGRAVYFYRVLGIVILICFMSFCFPSTSVPSSKVESVTPELSYEVVAQLDKAGKACRATGGLQKSSCAVEVWKSCHLARHSLESSSESVANGKLNAAEFLCDAAVIADAGELASVLASRYGEQYYRQSLFYIAGFSRNPFNLFHDLVDLEFWVLDASSMGYSRDTERIDTYELGVRLDGSSSNYPKYEAISPETVTKLRALKDAIQAFFNQYRTSRRFTQSVGSVPEVGISPWLVAAVQFQDTEAETEQLCLQARKAVREKRLRFEETINSCLSQASSCQNRSTANRIVCSPETGAAEFERMWQTLPDECNMANDITEQYSSDSCRLAALAICSYQSISPDDLWLGQLISMRDFACATAADTSELRLTLSIL